MVTVSLVLLALSALVIAVGIHLGPHTSIGAGGLSLVIAVVAVAFVASHSGSITTLSLLIYGLMLLLSLGTIGIGAKGIISAPKVATAERYKSLLGKTGVASTDLSPAGTVTVDGESWSAEALSGSIALGSKVFVVEADQIHLKVAIDTFDSISSTNFQTVDSTDRDTKDDKDNN